MKEDLEGKVPAGVVSLLQQNMNQLEKALLTSDPQMPSYLKESHKILISHPETVHLLDDTEISKLIDAAQKFTNTQIISAIAKSGAKRKGTGKLATDSDGNIDL